MKDSCKNTKLMSRRNFLVLSAATALGIPGCYLVDPVEKPKKPNPKPVVPSKQSDHVFYYERHDADYETYRQSFNKRITHSPKIIAVCLNETGVQEAVKYANYYKLPIAIKSGGHSFEGFCLNNDGMVIELSRLNSMSYDKTVGSFVAGPGCKLGNVYEYLNRFGKLLPAGSCGGVGVAGLTLGGGYGFFAREHGLTCDHLTKVKMVDGEGKLHSSTDNPELLWACKGGGNGNFGVITELTYKTVVAPKHFTSYRFKFYKLTPDKATSAAKLWFSAMESLPRSCYSAFVLNGKTLTVLLTDTAEVANTKLQSIVKRLSSAASRSYPARKRPLLRALTIYQGRPEPLFFKNVSAGYYRNFNDIEASFKTIATMVQQNRGTILQINTLGGEIANRERESSAAYPHRQFGFLGELQVYYYNESKGDKAVQTVQRIQHEFLKAGVTSHYRNYPDIDLPNWETAYYGGSYKRLKGLKNRYDPNDHIRHPQSIKPG